jgi:acetate kinase
MYMRILTVNGGSSSVKFALYEGEVCVQSGKIDHIGLPSAYIEYGAGDTTKERSSVAAPTNEAAVQLLCAHLTAHGSFAGIDAVAHRVVHGAHFADHALITPAVLAELRRMVPYDPEHMPGEIVLIEALMKMLGTVVHIACFDTVFHAQIPHHASLLALPRTLTERGLKRYGFHGLSYAYLFRHLTEVAGPETAHGRVIMAHLGNGASLCAVQNGVSVDTTMAFSPNSGIPMGTRSGDIDPGVVTYLARERGFTIEQIDALLSKESGLLGMSGTTYDMEELLAQESTEHTARVAVDAFCYSVRKQIGAYMAALGGADALVFSGGMGEKSAPVRSRVLSGLEGMGIELDAVRNGANEERISPDDAIPIYVFTTNEERTMLDIASRIMNTRVSNLS